MGLLPRLTPQKPAMPSADEVSQSIASMFDRTAATYEDTGVKFFTIFGSQLVEDVSLQPGESVLDVGCGRGAVLFPAASAVGPNGSVVGIDLSAEMIERTQAEITERAVGNAEVSVMDAQEPKLGGRTFDAVLASCVLFFLPDPAKALRAWHAALKPGGRVGVTLFGLQDERWADVQKIFGPYIPKPVLWTMAEAAKPFENDRSVAELFANAGFTGLGQEIRTYDITFDSPDQWVNWSMSQGQRFFWELIPPAQLPMVQTKTKAEAAKLLESDGKIHLTQVVRYVTATRG